ncbi:hypothetical protein OSB04_030222 [Centaurea solstitialis]|uniref:Cysteine proteinase inhibitor n=1 Tax=Centaurea solstitialis TaxID=347529 RepID=A0AA38S8D1_9ASTR|nr:hypothetical protein OSB04_030222 [Centaurea solstitialis]
MAATGGANTVEINDEVNTIARFAVDEHNKKESASLEFGKVVEAKQQVVQGKMYIITLEAKDGGDTKTFEAKVWVKSWENFQELQEFKQMRVWLETAAIYQKRFFYLTNTRVRMAVVGGISESKGVENSLEIDTLARFAIDEHNKKQNSLVEFVKVVNTKQQVVSGTMYYITLEAKDGGEKKTYEAKVWVKPWMNFQELQEFKLNTRMELVGGISESKGVENSLEMDTLARFAIDEHNKKQNSLVEFVKVVNTKQQVVCGAMYYITLEAKDGGEKKTYEATVWVKPWMNFQELQEFWRIQLELEFVKVVNVRQQIVEGTTYYITLEAKDEKDETEKKSTYEAEVWVTLNYSLQLVEFKQLLDDAASSSA